MKLSPNHLSQAGKALYYGRDRLAYQLQYPTTRRGTYGHNRFAPPEQPAPYNAYAALAYTTSVRSIAGHCATYTDLGEDLLSAVLYTNLDTGPALQRLRIMEPSERMAYVRRNARRMLKPQEVARALG